MLTSVLVSTPKTFRRYLTGPASAFDLVNMREKKLPIRVSKGLEELHITARTGGSDFDIHAPTLTG